MQELAGTISASDTEYKGIMGSAATQLLSGDATYENSEDKDALTALTAKQLEVTEDDVKKAQKDHSINEKKDADNQIIRVNGNYFVCNVSDGIVSKDVVIKVNEDKAFEVYDERNKEYVGSTSTINQIATGAVKGREYTFAPDVKLYGDTKVSYLWKV